MYRRTAVYVDGILKGAKPSDLAVEQPTKYEVIINYEDGRGTRVTVPATLLDRADGLIK